MKKLFFLFGVSSLFFSCATFHQPIGYVVTSPNIPLNMARNDGSVSGAIGYNHTEVLASYSPIKYVGLIGNYYARKNGNALSQGHAMELGAGLYYPFAKNFVVEGYAMKNVGSLAGSYAGDEQMFFNNSTRYDDIRSKYTGYSGQIDLGFKFYETSKLYMSAAMGYKMSWENFSDFYHLEQRTENNIPQPVFIEHYQNMNYRFDQFSLSVKVGWQFVRVGLQLSNAVSHPTISQPLGQVPYFNPVNESVLLEFFIPNRKKGFTKSNIGLAY